MKEDDLKKYIDDWESKKVNDTINLLKKIPFVSQSDLFVYPDFSKNLLDSVHLKAEGNTLEILISTMNRSDLRFLMPIFGNQLHQKVRILIINQITKRIKQS